MEPETVSLKPVHDQGPSSSNNSENMVFVIGGSGFIGRHVVRELVTHGKQVKVYDINPFPADEYGSAVEAVSGSILDYHLLRNAMDNMQTVFHLAANPGLWDRDPDVFDRVNHQGTENVICAARETGIERLVYTGTESILAAKGNQGLINENTMPVPEDIIGPYCRSKYLAEKAVLSAAKDGIYAVIASPTMPIGPGDINQTPPGKLIADFLNGKIPCYMDCTLNFVDVRDVAAGHVLAAEKGRKGQRYILAGHNLTLAKFFSLLGNASRRPAPKFKIPYSVALAWSYVEEWTGRLTGRSPQSSVTGVKLAGRSLAFDGGRTWRELGHTPRPIEESVRDAVEWHMSRIGI